MFPYGNAPLAILILAVVSGTAIFFSEHAREQQRPDLIFATFTKDHAEAYRPAIADLVRNPLAQFVLNDSYTDEVKDPTTGELRSGGVSFCHDMGAHNNFSPFGHSTYELPDLTGCFSYMTAEQLCSWSLIAASYVAVTADSQWRSRNMSTIDACLASLINRGGDAGFCQYDSSRCGSGGEITTYEQDRDLPARVAAGAWSC